tara:strand:- start:119 stop:499 length:381 start_codon:yes stop_codon:yes gene_type:complete
MDRIEELVDLPDDAGPWDSYSRNYARASDGRIVAVYVTVSADLPADAGCSVMLKNFDMRPCTDEEIAEVRRMEENLKAGQAEAGSSRWFADTSDLPAVNDGGCSVVNIVYDPKTERVESVKCNGLA